MTSLTGRLGLAALLAAGTAVSAQDIGITGRISFHTHFSQFVDNGKWDEWTPAFEERYPGTEVEVLPVSGYRKEMPARIASGDYGDVLNVLDNLPPGDDAKFYEPLTDLEMARTHRFVDRYRVDGEVYGYIHGANAEAVVFSKFAFAAAGIEAVPTTRSDLFAACEKLKDAGLTPMLINMGAGWPMQQWDKAAMLFADDGDYFNSMLEDAAPCAEGEPYGESIRFVKELFEDGFTERGHTADNWEESKMLPESAARRRIAGARKAVLGVRPEFLSIGASEAPIPDHFHGTPLWRDLEGGGEGRAAFFETVRATGLRAPERTHALPRGADRRLGDAPLAAFDTQADPCQYENPAGQTPLWPDRCRNSLVRTRG